MLLYVRSTQYFWSFSNLLDIKYDKRCSMHDTLAAVKLFSGRNWFLSELYLNLWVCSKSVWLEVYETHDHLNFLL